MSESSLEYLSAEKLSVSFNNKTLFKDLSFSLKKGETLAISGSNGSGKTTLLKIIATLLTPQKGKISYLDQNSESITDNFFSHLAYHSPDVRLYDDLTASENLEFALNHSKKSNEFADKLLNEFKILESKNLELKHFSTGMYQKLSLVIAFAKSAPLTILDEPCSNLDSHGLKTFSTLFKEREKSGLTIIASNLDQIINLCSRRICLD